MMNKIKVQEVVVVEGKYDLNSLKQIIDGVVITTDGFGIFRNEEKLNLIRRMAQTRGIVVLTDPDGAGFVIRNFLKGALQGGVVKHAYVPDIYGKERRKRTGSKEGKLGVEGMKPEVLRRALEKAGATLDGKMQQAAGGITKADLYAMGLSGTPGSAENRRKLMAALDLPEHLSPNALLDVLNALYNKEELMQIWTDITDNS